MMAMPVESGILPGQQYATPVYGGRCSNTFNTGLMRIAIQCGSLIILSHILHRIIFHPIGQPPVVSQLFTGLLIGPTVLGRIKIWHDFFLGTGNTKIMGSIVTIGRMFFMFLVGLEMDIPFLRRSLRRASLITLGTTAACTAAAVATSSIIYHATAPNGNPVLFLLILALLYANTASPIVIRMCAELKLATSEVGRLAISTALLNDMACLLILAIATTARPGPYSKRTGTQKLMGGFAAVLLLAMATAVLRPTVRWMNRRNEGRRHVGNLEVMGLLIFVMLVAVLLEALGYNSSMSCFLLGLVMPREGGMLRTMLDRLSYPVNNFILPIFFGFAAINTDMTTIRGEMVWAVVLMVALNIGSKVLGTIAATSCLGMPLDEGVVIGFLLNIKGHIDLVLVSLARGANIWGAEAQKVLLLTVLMATLTAGPAAALVIRYERRTLRYCSTALQNLAADTEFRILACVHSSRDVPTMLNLVEICGGGCQAESPLAVYLMHLVELKASTASYVLYHQHDVEDEVGWEDGEDDARIVTAACDMFCVETGIGLRQMTVVSAVETMQDDVYNATVDVRASLVVVPFHKHQRVDGRMQVGRNGVQQFNEKVMERIPCTVGLLIDRALDAACSGGNTPATGPNSYPLHQVAVLFFGGADDREALAFGMRLALHPCVALTVIQFLPQYREQPGGPELAAMNGDLFAAMSDHQREMEVDEAFLSALMRRPMAAGGHVAFVEKYVKNAAETVREICGISNIYSLFLVGSGRDGLSPLTRGMSEWEECPELGSVGDLLASSDSMCSGSVLVMRQYINPHFKHESGEDDEFSVM